MKITLSGAPNGIWREVGVSKGNVALDARELKGEDASDILAARERTGEDASDNLAALQESLQK